MTADQDFDRRFGQLMLDVLEREVGPHPVWADSPVAHQTADPRRRARSSRWPIRALAVAAVLVVGGGVVGAALVRQWADTSRPATNGWIAFAASPAAGAGGVDQTGGRGIFLIREGRTPRRIVGTDRDPIDHICPAFSPDGTRLAYGQGPVEGSTQSGATRDVSLAIADLAEDGSVAHAIDIPVGSSVQAPCPTWSPDGRRIAFSVPAGPLTDPLRSATGSSVWIVSIDDGQTTVLPDLLATDLKWSPDGTELAIARGFDTLTRRTPRDTALQMYSVATGELTRTGLSGVDRLTWSPDSTRIAYQRGSADNAAELWVADRDGGGGHQLFSGYSVNHGVGPVWSPDGEHIVFQRVCDKRPLELALPCREQHEVVVTTPDGASVVVLPYVHLPGTPATDLWYPFRATWSPAGDSLLYAAWGEHPETEALIVVPLDPALPPTLLYKSDTISAYDAESILPFQSWGRQPDR